MSLSNKIPQKVVDSHVHLLFPNENININWPKLVDVKYKNPPNTMNNPKFTVDYYNDLLKKDPQWEFLKTLYMEHAYGNISLEDEEGFMNNQIKECKAIEKLCEANPKKFVGFCGGMNLVRGEKHAEKYLNKLRNNEGKLPSFLKSFRFVSWLCCSVNYFDVLGLCLLLCFNFVFIFDFALYMF